MPPAPINISYSSARSPSHWSYASSSHMSPGLYIPVHKRTSSSGSSDSAGWASSRSSSSRSSSPTLSTRSDSSDISGVYTPSDLLLLAGSPLARLPLETLSSLRENIPDIMMNRRQRKSHRFRSLASIAPPPAPRPVANGRRKHAGRGSERRKAPAGDAMDGLNWRGVL